MVVHLGDGRWWDDEEHVWRDGSGKALRRLPPPHSTDLPMRRTRVVLATAHRAALCQLCDILHDKAEHLRRRRLTYLRRRALGDLFTGPHM